MLTRISERDEAAGYGSRIRGREGDKDTPTEGKIRRERECVRSCI
jgi:hypothetical protein